jgi:hypothetical protein
MSLLVSKIALPWRPSFLCDNSKSGVDRGLGREQAADGRARTINCYRIESYVKQYGVDQSEFKNFSPFDWWYQNPAVDQMYRDHNWDRTIEPHGQEDGIRLKQCPRLMLGSGYRQLERYWLALARL